jgi:carboxylesterase type B
MTQQGKVEGKMSPDGRVREFLGTPYAVPPLGQVMHLGPDAKAEPDHHRDRYLFLQQVWEK